MSAFSRGCLLRHPCPFSASRMLHLFVQPRSSQPIRFLSTTTLLRAAKQAGKSSLVKNSLQSRKPFVPSKSVPQNYQSYEQILAKKEHSTLLYQAPSHTLFIVTSYSTAAFCFSYAVFSFWSNSLAAPEGLATWVPIAFTGISFGMAAFGGWLMLGPARLIRTITAIPKNASSPVGTSMVRDGELAIEITLRKMFPLPFFPARQIYASPNEIVLPKPLSPAAAKRTLSREELIYIERQEAVARKAQLEYEKSHIMSAPFRHMNRAFYELFKALGRTWSREGFMKVKVKSGYYKLDVSGGWALDAGRALDRLTMQKPIL